MDTSKDDPDSYERFSADDDGLALRARRRQPTNASNLYRNVFALLLFAAVSAYLFNRHISVPQLIPQARIAPRPSAVSNPVPPIYTADALLAPKPLAECIKPDNIIDEAVATCRYGQFPRASQNEVAQGMVSASYLARFKAEQQPARTKRVIAQNVERDTVWQWDGKRTYAAEWTIINERIDGTSVCANYRRGSIEHRECRKGVKVYFREKCREWSARASKDGADFSLAIKQRFCSAADSFNPLS
ncbi:hypothetical protein AABC73_01285 [Pseudomonas sp. G.S.17]|uniref:hypothetical protein n=1 Tax=Pseudomonas sp. G.S.17 TaxID=3137451 RepID=UPI00311C91C2